MSKNDKPVPITALEENRLLKVFEMLCDYNEKRKIDREIQDLKAWLVNNQNKMNAQISAGQSISAATMDLSNQSAVNKIEELNKQNAFLESRPDKKITWADILQKLKELNQKATRKDVEEMIWEVDENLDGCIDWSEFRLMFNRNIMDRTGLEPNSMFNLTQFLIYDTNGNGCVSVDETMNLLYARYGRTTMEAKLKEMFGEDMQEFGRQGGEISYSNYLRSMENGQMSLFTSTNKGQIALSKGYGKTMAAKRNTETR